MCEEKNRKNKKSKVMKENRLYNVTVSTNHHKHSFIKP